MGSNISFVKVGTERGDEQITVFIDGKAHTIDSGHPNFNRIDEAIMQAVESEDFDGLSSQIKELVADVSRRVMSQFGDRVSLDGSTLYFDGEPLYNRLANTILDFYRAGRPFNRLVLFLEKLMQNPSRNSREQLYEYLERNNFQITEDGDFIAYKGLDYDLRSIHAGPGIVNGVEHNNANLDNSPGNLVQLERRQVVDDPKQGCSFGLHVGDFSYASSFGNRLVEVLVNPKHVVSVPDDSSFRKVRTCEYQVLREVTREGVHSTGFNEEASYQAEDEFRTWLGRLAAPYSSYAAIAQSFTELAERFLEGVEDASVDYLNAVRSMAARLDKAHTGITVNASLINQVTHRDDDYSVEETDDEWDEEEDEWGDEWGDEEEDEEEVSVDDFLDWLEEERGNYSRKGKMALTYEDLAERFVDEAYPELEWSDELTEFVNELDAHHTAAAVYAYHVDTLLLDNDRGNGGE